jgi:tetratricopeptide (TPR) repeat protein
MTGSELGWVRAIWSGLTALIAPIRRLWLERRAGGNPHAATRDRADDLLDGALGRLGATTASDTQWDQLEHAIGAAFVRPEHFSLQHMRDWLSHPDANAALRRVARARLVSAPESDEDREKLLSIYMEISGEHKNYAESNVFAAVTFLTTSVQEAAKDSGVAAISQAGFESMHDRFDEVIRKVDSSIPAKKIFGSGAVLEHHGKDAHSRLESILRRRATLGVRVLDELQKLAMAIGEEGEFAAAPPSVRGEVQDWIARMSASHGRLVECESALAELSRLGREPSPSTLAWAETARGNVEGALWSLAEVDSADCRSTTFGILRAKRNAESALAYFDSLHQVSANTFTPPGWTNVIGCLSENDRLDRATAVASSLPDSMVNEWPMLGYMRGIVYAANATAPEVRGSLFREGFLAASEHLLDGDDADRWRRSAYSSFEACSEKSEAAGDDALVRTATAWLRWLRLVDPSHRVEELATLKSDMSDAQKAVELIPLAHAFKVKFDPSALEWRLDRAEMVSGLSLEEMNAKILMLRHLGRFAELASFIEDKWDLLAASGPKEALAGTLIDAHVQAGDCDRAEQAFEANREVLHPADVPRFQLMIGQCKGEDPTRQAREIYEASGQLVDLINLVRSLEMNGRWTELAPFALELFKREPNSENMRLCVACMRKNDDPVDDLLHFLDEWPDLVTRNLSLLSARGWALFHQGRLPESFEVNSRLLANRFDVNDVALDLNLAVRMGDWERLPAILEREWGRRDKLPVELLLHMARLASSRARERSLELVKESIERQPENPRSLLQAHSVATALGCDDVAMPLVAKAAALSQGNEGPVMTLSMREMVEMLRESSEDWRKKNELFRGGTVPIHWSASVLNVPLSRLLIAIPRENRRQTDARKRQPIPIISGARNRTSAGGVRRIALDITSVLILGDLGFLFRLVEVLDHTSLSPRFMESLLFEEEKVRFHQPSRIHDAKPLIDLHGKGLLNVVGEEAPSGLVAEVGDEMAALLAAAKRFHGVCVHSGKLFRIGSYMDTEADVGEYVSSLSCPAAVATALHAEGRVTTAERDKALQYLERVSSGETGGATPGVGAPVFLDRVSADHLNSVDLLEILIGSNRKVFVHAAAIEEWQALIDTERHGERMVGALEGIRDVVRRGVASGKVGFLREGGRDDMDSRLGIHAQPMVDLFEDVSQVDSVCIDDRLLNSKNALEDRKGAKTLLLCSLDLIDMLVERGVATSAERDGARHRMRESCYMAIPIRDDELVTMLSDAKVDELGVLIESAGLRVIREYLARLHSSNFLCSESDLEYLDELWRVGQRVVRRLWADEESSVVDTVARADWVVDHVVPDAELALRFASNGRERMKELAVARLVASLLPIAMSDTRGKHYSRWVERKIIGPHLPASSSVVSEATRRIGEWVMQRSVEIANELPSNGGEDPGQGNAGGGGSQAAR